MKSIKVYKLSAALVFACLVITSCPSPFLQSYYIQQQNRSAGNEGGSEQEDPGNGDTPIPSEEPLEPGKISMFSVILPDGKLSEPNNDTTVHDQLAGKLNVSDGFPFQPSSSAEALENPELKKQKKTSRNDAARAMRISRTDFRFINIHSPFR